MRSLGEPTPFDPRVEKVLNFQDLQTPGWQMVTYKTDTGKIVQYLTPTTM